IGTKHMEPGTIGDDVDVHVLVLGPVIFDHVRGIVQRQVHHLRVILVDMDRKAMFCLAAKRRRGEGDCEKGSSRKAGKHERLRYSSFSPPSLRAKRSNPVCQFLILRSAERASRRMKAPLVALPFETRAVGALLRVRVYLDSLRSQ